MSLFGSVGGGLFGGVPKRTSGVLSGPRDATTSPRLICASSSKVPPDYIYTGAPRVAVRQRLKPAAGRWSHVAFVVAHLHRSQGQSGSLTSEWEGDLLPYRGRYWLELCDGTRTVRHQDAENANGTIREITWEGGESILSVHPGSVVVSDLISAQDCGYPYFEWPSRERFPWIRAALGSLDDVANVALPCLARRAEERFFQQDFWRGDLASFAAAVTVASRTGTTNGTVIGGSTGWLYPNTFQTPQPVLMMVGVPLDGQEALMVVGTSIEWGEGDAPDNTGQYLNTEPGPGPRVWDESGWPHRAFEGDLDGDGLSDGGFPLLNLPQSGSRLINAWGDGAAALNANVPSATSLRDGQLRLARFFDWLHCGHGVNDGGASATPVPGFEAAVRRFSKAMKAARPGLRVSFGKTPIANGATGSPPTIAGQSQRDARDAAIRTSLDGLLAEGAIDRIVDFRTAHAGGTPGVGAAGSEFAWDVEATVFTGTLAAGSTTTVLNVAGSPDWPADVPHWGGSWVKVGGETRAISSSGSATLTLASPLTTAPGAGAALEIVGVLTTDGVHPNAAGHRRLARRFLAEGVVKAIPRAVSGDPAGPAKL